MLYDSRGFVFAGVAFFFTIAALGIWSLWQRRHAWGWWESHTTIHVGLLVIGALLATPILFAREQLWWWGHSAVTSAVFVFSGLAAFAVTLKRRTDADRGIAVSSSRSIIVPTAAGLTVIVADYFLSGASGNAWLLDPAAGPIGVGARIFWLTVSVEQAYLLSVIATYLLILRADTRRGDRGPVTIYLGSCMAGMGLVVVAMGATGGYGATPAVLVGSAILVGLMTAGNVLTGGLSWRRKVNRIGARSAPRIPAEDTC